MFSMKAKNTRHTGKSASRSINEFFLVAGEDIAKAAQAASYVGSHDAFRKITENHGGLRNCVAAQGGEIIAAGDGVTLNGKVVVEQGLRRIRTGM